MALDFRRTRITFDPTRGQEQSESSSVTFPSRVLRAEVALNGFDSKYSDGDHHVLRHKVDASIAQISDRTVTARVDFLLRDSSGTVDDRYAGTVDVLVIAEVA